MYRRGDEDKQKRREKEEKGRKGRRDGDCRFVPKATKREGLNDENSDNICLQGLLAYFLFLFIWKIKKKKSHILS